jgi:hypothetical protein
VQLRRAKRVVWQRARPWGAGRPRPRTPKARRQLEALVVVVTDDVGGGGWGAGGGGISCRPWHGAPRQMPVGDRRWAGAVAVDSPARRERPVGPSRIALAEVASYLYVVCSYPYIGRRCQILGDHPIFFGRRPLIGKLLEQCFCSILPKKVGGSSLTHIQVSCWSCSNDLHEVLL